MGVRDMMRRDLRTSRHGQSWLEPGAQGFLPFKRYLKSRVAPENGCSVRISVLVALLTLLCFGSPYLKVRSQRSAINFYLSGRSTHSTP